MTVKKVAYESQPVPTSGVIGYSCPSDAEYAEVTYALCTNEDAANENLTVYIVESGGSPGAANTYIDGRVIVAGSNDTLDELIGLVLDPGDKIVPLAAAAADRLNFKIGIKVVY